MPFPCGYYFGLNVLPVQGIYYLFSVFFIQIRKPVVSDLRIVTLPRHPGNHNMWHLFSCIFFYILCFTGVIVNGGFRPTTAM